MHTFVLAFALQVMLPLFDATPQLARVSILNKSSEAADFDIGVNAENGSVRRVKKIRLAARQQTILSVNEIGTRPRRWHSRMDLSGFHQFRLRRIDDFE
jgi:hypothetical protein